MTKEENYQKIYDRRLTSEKLATMKPEERKKAMLMERLKCSQSLRYLIETYFTVDAGAAGIQPFILFKYQRKVLEDYIKYPNNITMKTRQMGFTTFTGAFIACMVINTNNFKTLIISKEMISAKKFLKTIKDILDYARTMTRIAGPDSPSWLVPEYLDGYNNKESFHLTNKSLVEVQGNTEDSGRGFSALNLAIVDEVAAIDSRVPGRMEEIWGAMGPALSTVRGRTIMISTPKGSNGWYYNTYTNSKKMGFNVIDAHWTEHPMFSMGRYTWISDETHPDKGYVKFFDEQWPKELFDKEQGIYIPVDKATYKFNKDGRERSPWYDFESAKLGPRKTACELDCSFVGTGGEVLGPELLRDIKSFATSCKYNNIQSKNGLMKDYHEFKAPIPGHNYVVASDVMTGDGSDWSTITVLDLDTLDICGSYMGQPLPSALAYIVMEIAYRFNTAWAVVENAGGGGTTLQSMKTLNYPKIYYSILKKKDESSGVRKRKLGLWVAEDTRDKGGDALEEYLRNNKIKIPDLRYSDEFYNWIWDKDSKRRHAPGRHDDMIMSLQWAIYFHAYVYKRNVRNRDNFSSIFNIQRTGTFQGVAVQQEEEFNPYYAKKNNGRDIIDQKRNFYKQEEEESMNGQNGKRRGGLFL